MTRYWQGRNYYPQEALYFGIEDNKTGGIDNEGTYQVLVTENPDEYKVEEESFNKGRIFINASTLSEEEKDVIDNNDISGLGNFKEFPSKNDIINRLKEFK